jgi:predicted metal-dependent HD superfamily phosphohydrolase
MEDWLAALPKEWTTGLGPEVFTIGRCSYETPGRHYHTWEHVLECFAKLRLFSCASPRNVFLALLFHDAVYVPGRPDNEQESAALAAATLESYSTVPAQDVAAVRRMIMATSEHRAADWMDEDVRIVLDIDMSILGAEPARYRRYVQDVRLEFASRLPDLRRYRMGRLRFLQGLGLRARLFATPLGIERWEARARENIRWEAGELRREQGWAERAATSVMLRLGWA